MATDWALPSRRSRSRIPRPAATLAFLLAILSALGGCTTLHVFGADGIQKTTLRFPGFVDITFDSPGGALGYIRSSIGIGASSDGVVLGYARTTAVRITNPEVCQAVILVTSEEAARDTYRLIADLGAMGHGFCVERREETP